MQKEKYDAQVEELSKKLNFNDKMKKHTKKTFVLFESFIQT